MALFCRLPRLSILICFLMIKTARLWLNSASSKIVSLQFLESHGLAAAVREREHVVAGGYKT